MFAFAGDNVINRCALNSLAVLTLRFIRYTTAPLSEVGTFNISPKHSSVRRRKYSVQKTVSRCSGLAEQLIH